jgi:type I restriction enzyme, S subunit
MNISNIENYAKSLGWDICRVVELFDIQQGKSVSKKRRLGNNQRPFLRTRNVFWGKLDLEDLDTMHFSEAEVQKLEINFGDLLLCEGGAVGRTAVWENEVKDCYYQNHLHRLRVINELKIDAYFALYWFWYAFDVGNVYLGRSNVTTIPNLSKSRLSEFEIPRPPLLEQRKIALVLKTLQQAIEQQQNIIKMTHELQLSLLNKYISEGVNDSWQSFKIQDVFEFTKKPRGNALPNPIPFVTMNLVPVSYYEINEYELRENVSSGAYVENQDLLVAKITPSFENGKQGILNIPFENAMATTEVIPIKAIEGKSNLLFLHYYLLDKNVRSELAGKMEGSTGRQRLSKTILGEYFIPMPKEVSIQNEISQNLLAFDKKLPLLRKKKLILEELLRTLLNKLMTGKIRVDELVIDEELLKG